MITLRQLRVFVAVAEHGGTAAAARALHLSQPAVSSSVRELEASLGVALFVRRPPRGLALTPAGRTRLAEARRLLAGAAAFEGGTAASAPSGRVGFAYFSTLGPTHVPWLVRRIRDALPAVTLDLAEGDLDAVDERLASGRSELALTYDVGMSAGMQARALQSLPFYAALPAGHRLARRRRVSLKDLAREDFVLVDLPHSREFLLSPFWQHGLSPRIAHRASSLEMARGLVAHGLGVSLLVTRPSADVAYDGQPIACRLIREDVAPQRLVLQWSAAFERTAASAAVAEEVQRAFDEEGVEKPGDRISEKPRDRI